MVVLRSWSEWSVPSFSDLHHRMRLDEDQTSQVPNSPFHLVCLPACLSVLRLPANRAAALQASSNYLRQPQLGTLPTPRPLATPSPLPMRATAMATLLPLPWLLMRLPLWPLPLWRFCTRLQKRKSSFFKFYICVCKITTIIPEESVKSKIIIKESENNSNHNQRKWKQLKT